MVLVPRSLVASGGVQRWHSNRRVRGISEGRDVHGLPRALLQEAHGSSSGVRVVGKGQPLFALQRYRSEDATFRLGLRQLRRQSEGGTTRVLYAALVLPHLDSFSFEKVSRQVRTRVVGVYPLSPKPPARRLGGCGVAVAQAEPGLILRLWMLRLLLRLMLLLRRRAAAADCGG